MDKKESLHLIKELNKAIGKRMTVNNPKIRDWKQYKNLTDKLIEARQAIFDSKEGK